MNWSEAKSWLDILGVKAPGMNEEIWKKMDENTRAVFMSDVRVASGNKDKNESATNN